MFNKERQFETFCPVYSRTKLLLFTSVGAVRTSVCSTRDSHTLRPPTQLYTHTHTLKRTDAGLSVAGEHEAGRTLTAESSGLIAADGVGSTDVRSLPALVHI